MCNCNYIVEEEIGPGVFKKICTTKLHFVDIPAPEFGTLVMLRVRSYAESKDPQPVFDALERYRKLFLLLQYFIIRKVILLI